MAEPEEEEEDAEAQPGSTQEERGWAFAKKEPGGARECGCREEGQGSGPFLSSPLWGENSRDSIHRRTDRIPERTQPWKRDDWSVVAL